VSELNPGAGGVSPLSSPAPDLARTLFDEAGDALFLVDPVAHRVLDANPMAQRLSEFSRAELLGRTITDLLRHEQAAEDWLRGVRRTTTYHGRDGFLLRCKRPGVWVPVSVSIARLHPPGGKPLALFTVRDQSEQVEAYHCLLRTEAELRRVLVSVTDCLWSCQTDAAGRWHYRYLSPVVERITGRPVGFFLDDPLRWEEAVHPDDLPRRRELLAGVSTGTAAEIEYRLRRPDGTVRWVRESISAAAVAGQKGLLLHGVLTDITERRQAEQAIQERNLLEAQRYKSLGVLAGGVAHDFNNLLTAIVGNANLAQLDVPAGSPVRDHLKQIESVAWRAAELCQQMLAYAGKGRLLSGPVNLSTLVQDSRDLLHATVSRQAALTLDLAAELPSTWADATQMRQVLMNLIRNASEALVEGRGNICVATGKIHCDAGSLHAEPFAEGLAEGDYVFLEVTDNGCGMTAEVKAQMFEPFFTTKFQGRGLGLAATLGIVRGHGGTMQVHSAPGAGTAVRVLLPVSGAPAPPVAGPHARFPLEEQKGTVLVADDEEVVREVAVEMLEAVGFRTLLAKDGLEALEQFQQHANEVSLVLLDFTMPRQNGDEVFRELRRLRPDLPVVLMSGYAPAELRPRFREAEPSICLQKPFSHESLFAAVRQAQSGKTAAIGS
jgi:PAS domain S-box-containing protein